MLRKGKYVGGIIWLVAMIWYVVQHKSKPPDSEDLSIQGLKGKKANGKPGLCRRVIVQAGLSPLLA